MRNYLSFMLASNLLVGLIAPPVVWGADEPQLDVVAEPTRILDIKSVINFRDIGGYVTVDGRSTAWRKIFRSGDFSRFSPQEQLVVSALGIATVIDLRSDEERARGPSLWYDESDQPEIILLPIGGSAADWFSKLSRQLQVGGFSREEIHATFIEMYAAIPLENMAEYSALFTHILASDAAPILVHCTGGKDRTGIAAALILSALDVPRVTIMQDFMLTNEAIDVGPVAKMLAMILSKNSDHEIDPVAIEPMLIVQPIFLETAFAAIDAEYGSMDNYLQDALGLTAARRAKLKNVLLD
ncbi:MAG: tyrosine-protein phosphatase [Gammaproteobacteria bacterium]|nr:MAG: tyrosine-protein phosphatase [Gammaproteobacteria bacterium]